jgi:nuclease S1
MTIALSPPMIKPLKAIGTLLKPPHMSGAVCGGMRTLLAATLIGWLGALSPPAAAFGAVGHRLIAEIAQSKLSAPTRGEVDRLLALEPGATLASISTWADETRSPRTAAWHYVNFHRGEGCRYDAARLCPEGNCVVGAIEAQAAVLASKAPDAERLTALKYLVHLVADVHQPLHAGYFDDRGGNSYQLQAFDRGTNMHAVWDSALINAWPDGFAALRQQVDGTSAPKDTSFKPAAWAEESCRIVGSEGFYPEGRFLPSDYLGRWATPLAERLNAAALRLTSILRDAFEHK